MGDIAAFPTIRNVFCEGDNIIDCIAAGTIKQGMVVSFHTTGVSFSVQGSKKGTSGQPIGVALNDATTGQRVAVAGDDCIVNVANADDTAAIDAGDVLEDNDNAILGTVSTVDLMDAGVVLVMKYQVGIAVDIIAGGSYGRMLVSCGRMESANNA